MPKIASPLITLSSGILKENSDAIAIKPSITLCRLHSKQGISEVMMSYKYPPASNAQDGTNSPTI